MKALTRVWSSMPLVGGLVKDMTTPPALPPTPEMPPTVDSAQVASDAEAREKLKNRRLTASSNPTGQKGLLDPAPAYAPSLRSGETLG